MISRVWRMASVRVPWVTGNRDGFLGTPKEVSSNRGYQRGALKGTSQVWEVSSWYFRPVARLGWIQAVVGFAGWEGGHLHSLCKKKRCLFSPTEKTKWGWGEGGGWGGPGSRATLEGLYEWVKGRRGQTERLRGIRRGGELMGIMKVREESFRQWWANK